MAQPLLAPVATDAPAAPALHLRNADLDRRALREARVDLAACFRAAAALDLSEGVCNHLSALVPGRDDLMLVNPLGLAFEEVTASSLLVCDVHGRVLEGHGAPEATAFHIHARLHARHGRPRAVAAFHTHMPHATALAITDGEPLVFAGQTSLRFWGRVAVDRGYNGLALDGAEGDRIAEAMGETADVVFLRSHGVVVLGRSVAEAWDDLYYLERVARTQVLAQSTGRPLTPIPEEVARRTAAQIRDEAAVSARLHLDSVKRRLAREQPDFLD